MHIAAAYSNKIQTKSNGQPHIWRYKNSNEQPKKQEKKAPSCCMGRGRSLLLVVGRAFVHCHRRWVGSVVGGGGRWEERYGGHGRYWCWVRLNGRGMIKKKKLGENLGKMTVFLCEWRTSRYLSSYTKAIPIFEFFEKKLWVHTHAYRTQYVPGTGTLGKTPNPCFI